MFGDFSRFENDPEVGLNGIYLSQGSPILDSDWNEQVAALTDWITVVGRLAAGDTLRRIGFDVTSNNKVIEVSPGVALLSGRSVHSVRKLRWESLKNENGKIYTTNQIEKGKEYGIYLVAVDNLLSDMSRIRGRRVRTDWRIVIDESVLLNKASVDLKLPEDSATSTHASAAKSYGDTAHLTARMAFHWNQTDTHSQTVLMNSTVCLIECDTGSESNPKAIQFKVATSPENWFIPHEWASESAVARTLPTVTYTGTGCTVLDMLTSPTDLWVEYEDDAQLFTECLSLLKDRAATFTSKLRKATYAPHSRELRIENGDWNLAKDAKNPRVRVWNAKRASGAIFTIFAQVDKSDSDPINFGRVQGTVLLDDGAALIRGDRWYVPVENGMPAMKIGDSLPGQRRFMAVARLRTLQVNNDDSWNLTTANDNVSINSSYVKVEGKADAFQSTATISQKPEYESGSTSFQPVAHRLDDSLHRLTGALNAARSLTRQTPCKELTTRVSYLPLRRWLASAYVHEIADLDLDGFLAKVRRSIDVAPEDEHRFREQAALILDEANQLAGSITPRPRSDTNRESDTMVSTPSDNSHPMTLGSATRDALQQAFTQEIPRA